MGGADRSDGATVVHMDDERSGKSHMQRRAQGSEDELLDADDQTEVRRW